MRYRPDRCRRWQALGRKALRLRFQRPCGHLSRLRVSGQCLRFGGIVNGLFTVPRVGLAEHGCGVLVGQESPSVHFVFGRLEEEAVLERQIEVMPERVCRLMFSCLDISSDRQDVHGVLNDIKVLRKVQCNRTDRNTERLNRIVVFEICENLPECAHRT